MGTTTRDGEILDTVALWSEVTRFNIGTGVKWRSASTASAEAEEAA